VDDPDSHGDAVAVNLPRWVRVLLWIVLIFLIYAIFRSPQDAAQIVTAAIQGIGAGLGAVFAFFDAILAQL
jgi:hypothetical protein